MMRSKLKLIVIMTAFLLTMVGFLTNRQTNVARAQQAAATPTPTATPFDQAAAIAKLKEQIKGRENEPAPVVFKNIQTMKNMPAGRLLAIMEMGFSKSLGVNCTHCHVPCRTSGNLKTGRRSRRHAICRLW